ncbi:MAG TPA: hypothetical protein ENK18_02850 [Deltaproteobacteria bacterium]|nr:hypothetical protein [Deltaproteobacteria bacterium]
MRSSRRRFITGITALSAGLTACRGVSPAPSNTTLGLDRAPEPPPWEPDGMLDLEAFAWGVQVGDVTSDSALLSVQTTEPTIDLAIVRQRDETWVEVGARTGLEVTDGFVQVTLDQLDPDTAYQFVARTPDGARRSHTGRLRTALGPDRIRRIVFGATSCLGDEAPDFENLAWAAKLDLDFFLLLGDTVYAHATTLEEYRADWRQVLATDSVRDLCASTSLIATWDDHEVANNWILGETVGPDQLLAATTAFREAIPQRQGPSGGLWRSIRWGDVIEVVVLDSRGERIPPDQIVSEEQLDWAIETLQQSTATFKLLLCSVHLADHTELWGAVEADDRWQGFPEQRSRLVEALEGVEGVVVLTGDMHYGSVHHLAPPGQPGAGIWEIAVGPSGSTLNLLAELALAREQYPMMLAEHSCCVFTADPLSRTLVVDFIGDDGSVLASQILTV